MSPYIASFVAQLRFTMKFTLRKRNRSMCMSGLSAWKYTKQQASEEGEEEKDKTPTLSNHLNRQRKKKEIQTSKSLHIPETVVENPFRDPHLAPSTRTIEIKLNSDPITYSVQICLRQAFASRFKTQDLGPLPLATFSVTAVVPSTRSLSLGEVSASFASVAANLALVSSKLSFRAFI